MDLATKIFIAGHTSLIGSAIRKRLDVLGYKRLLLRTPDELDLTRQDAVEELFSWERPDYVFLAQASRESQESCLASADLLYQSLATEFNVISSSNESGVKRLLLIGASCIYPRWTHQSLEETCFLPKDLDLANRAHALAKLTGVELCDTYNREHGYRFLAAMPSNPDRRGHAYNLDYSNLIPAMIVKIHKAKLADSHGVVLPGRGNLHRGFLYSDDMANACVSLMSLNDHDFAALASGPAGPLVDIGCEVDLTLRELAESVAEVVNFHGELLFEVPDAEATSTTPLNVAVPETLVWHSKTNLKDRLRQAYNDFLFQTDPMDGESADGLSLVESAPQVQTRSAGK